MKIRNGFVSNSSSSSFIIEGDIATIASGMLDVVIDEFGYWNGPTYDNGAVYKQWKDNLKKAISMKDVQNGKIGITFPSCNYDSYIIKDGNKVYVSTCNNHDWSSVSSGALQHGGGADCGDEDECYKRVEQNNFFNLRNGLIHSCEKFFPFDKKYPNCPETGCKGFYGQYVEMDGQKICGACYKGVFGGKKKKPIKTKEVKLTNKEIDSLINGLACAYDQSQDLDTDLETALTLRLKDLRKQKYDT
jgi:hypothetical protein